jgi:hypothetical protein
MARQALRLKPVPEQLAPWLDLIKGVPGDEELPDWNLPNEGKLTGQIIKSWDLMLSALPINIQQFVRFKDDIRVESDWASQLEKYQLVWGALSALRRIAEFSVRIGEDEGYVSLLTKEVNISLGDIVPKGSGYIYADETGKIQFKKSPIITALENVEANRIRKCEYTKCGRIYWAGRLDQRCCGKNCANSRRVQKHRDKKDQYKFNRYCNEERKHHGTI